MDLNPVCAHFCYLPFGSQFLHLYDGRNDSSTLRELDETIKIQDVLGAMPGMWRSGQSMVIISVFWFAIIIISLLEAKIIRQI